MVNQQQIDIEEEVAYVERLQRTIRHLRRELQEAQSEGAYLRSCVRCVRRSSGSSPSTRRCLTGWTPTWRPAAGLRKRPRGRGTSASGRTEGRDDE